MTLHEECSEEKMRDRMTWKGTEWSAVSWLDTMRGTCGGKKGGGTCE